MTDNQPLNDNSPHRRHVYDEREPSEDEDPIIGRDKMRFVPVASYLIERYRPNLFLLGYECFDYGMLESHICFWLTWPEDDTLTKKFIIGRLADYLGISPIQLFNDKKFIALRSKHNEVVTK